MERLLGSLSTPLPPNPGGGEIFWFLIVFKTKFERFVAITFQPPQVQGEAPGNWNSSDKALYEILRKKLGLVAILILI